MLEYVPGSSLRAGLQRLVAVGPLSEQLRVAVALQAARGALGLLFSSNNAIKCGHAPAAACTFTVVAAMRSILAVVSLPWLLGEAARNEVLQSSLQQPMHRPPTWCMHARCVHACAGMEYLHSQHVVHFDLKCDNLLADLRDVACPTVKIGDMGLSKQKAATFLSGNMRGTLPWMAPELFPATSRGKAACCDGVGVSATAPHPISLFLMRPLPA